MPELFRYASFSTTGDTMTEIVVAKIRSFLIRGLAVLALIGTYALSGVGPQILSTVGLSSFVMATTTTPADAHWRRRRYRRHRYVRRRRRRRRYWW
jgi:hypothetical protein